MKKLNTIDRHIIRKSNSKNHVLYAYVLYGVDNKRRHYVKANKKEEGKKEDITFSLYSFYNRL